MNNITEKLAKNKTHVRVDLYCNKSTIYFGELTFFHGSGFEHFKPKEWDQKIGEWIK
jgi:hypothetical protein